MDSLYVVCGTYDGSVFLLNGLFDENNSNVTLLKPVFIDPDAHSQSISALDISGDLIASGSSDEYINVFSISHKKRLGSLELHSSAIKSLKFANQDSKNPSKNIRHLISASTDSCIAIWGRCHRETDIKSTWECLRQMKRHRGSVNSIALHPSNKLLLSIGEDKTMRMWNLLHGRQTIATSLKNSEYIDFSPSGAFLLIQYNKKLDIISLASFTKSDGSILCTFDLDAFLSADSKFIHESDTHLYVAIGKGRNIQFLRCSKNSDNNNIDIIGNILVPGKRVKCLDSSIYKGRENVNEIIFWFASTESDVSYVRGYKVNLSKLVSFDDPTSITILFTYDVSNARVTKMCTSWRQAALENEKANILDDDDEMRIDSENSDDEYESSDIPASDASDE